MNEGRKKELMDGCVGVGKEWKEDMNKGTNALTKTCKKREEKKREVFDFFIMDHHGHAWHGCNFLY